MLTSAAIDRGDAARRSPAETAPARAGARIATLAVGALAREVLLTPKPGLVDRRNTGAHRDMDLGTFRASIRAMAPFFPRFHALGARMSALPGRAFMSVLRSEGIVCERAMFAATGGVNTHKGAVFAMGLLTAAAGRLCGRDSAVTVAALAAEVAAISGHLVGTELRRPLEARTAGERLFQRHGLTGARGEAASGFLTARAHALPAFRRAMAAGRGERLALHAALLELMAENADTNVVARGGLDGLAFVQTEARALRQAGGIDCPDYIERLARLDDALIARHLSPGGSADLLSVTWFLSRFADGDCSALPTLAPNVYHRGEATDRATEC